MDAILNHLDLIAPAFFSMLSIVLLRKKAQWLCYPTVLIAIFIELLPPSINVIGLLICIACLCTLLMGNILRSRNITHPFSRLRILGIGRLLG